jgi:ATP-dependent Clp protease ATP-binding subunit ClpA
MQIVDLLVREVDERLREQGLTLELTPTAKKLLVREGYNPAYGARPLRRTVQRLVKRRCRAICCAVRSSPVIPSSSMSIRRPMR